MADNEGVSSRDLLKVIALTVAAAALATSNAAPVAKESQARPASQSHAHAPAPARNDNTADAFRFFTAPEAAVVVALVDTLIPKDDVGPGGVEVGVPTFIDREMASAYGRGARMYLDGPFGEGTPQQGYQLPLAPPELYRVGIADLNAWCVKTRGGKTFDQLSAADRTAALKDAVPGPAEFTQVPARAFFNIVLQNTMEGYFADPIHGGNHNKAVWKMIGFPGAIGM